MDTFHPRTRADTPRAPIPIDEAFRSGVFEVSTHTHCCIPHTTTNANVNANANANTNANAKPNTNTHAPSKKPLELLDLPLELLLSIFAHLPAPTLHTLSRLSTRTHHLALPLFLAHRGLGPARGTLVLSHTHAGAAETSAGKSIDTDTEIMHLLSSALFRPSIHGVWCTFDFYKPRGEVLGLVRRVRGALGRLGRVREAHADFMGVGGWSSWSRTGCGRGGGDTGQGEMEDGDKAGSSKEEEVAKKEMEEDDDDVVDWEAEVRGMLDGFVERGCETMTVCLAGSCIISAPHTLERVLLSADRPTYALLPRCIKTLTSSPWWTPSAPCPPTHKNALTTFNLHSSMLFHASFCPWTLSTLNASSLSTLSLQHIDIHPHAWGLILPRITLPLLVDLAIDTCSVYYADLAPFLVRHPSIQRLKLGRNLRAPTRVSPTHQRQQKQKQKLEFLPRVTHLFAPPAFLVHLLSPPLSPCVSPSTPLRALKTVTIITRIPYKHHFDFTAMDAALAPVAARLMTLEVVALEVEVESSGDEWMVLDVLPSSPSPSPDSPSRNSNINTPPPPPTPTPTQKPIPIPTPITQQHIARLEVRFKLYRLPEDVAARLPAWVALFTGVREVGIWMPGREGVFSGGVGGGVGVDSGVSGNGSGVTQNGGRGDSAVEGAQGEGMTLIRALFSWCGERLEGVGVNGVVRSLEGWVEEEARGGGKVCLPGKMEML